MDHALGLSEAIQDRGATVGIVGVGYVGSALAEATTSAGFPTIGFDIDQKKVASINRRKSKRLTATTDMSRLARCDVICVCVPTPIFPDKTPDLRSLENALEKIATYLRRGQLIVIESSVATGATRNFVVPILQKTKLQEGLDFFVAFSPERVDPGNKIFTMTTIPKIVAGLDQRSTELAVRFYRQFIQHVIPVSSPEVAELAKLLENSFRLINISFINELAIYARSLGVDIWEVLAAASTKPFGFLAHHPGPGAKRSKTSAMRIRGW